MRPSLLSLALLAACTTASEPHPVAPGAPIELDAALEAIRARHDVPALGGALLRGDRVVALGVTGTRKLGDGTPVTPSEQWHLGSCSKAMTATVLALLVEQGKLSWSTTLAQAFPEMADTMDPGYRDVTVAQLLRHEGGAPPLIPIELWEELRLLDEPPRMAREMIVQEILHRPPTTSDEQRVIYSNAGYAIAAAIGERVDDRAWEEQLRTALCTPLGITTAGVGAPGTEGAILQPWGHLTGPNGIEPVPPGPQADSPPALAPSGAIHMSLSDWARFAALHLGALSGNAAIVSPATLAELHRPGEYGTAMGWGVMDQPWSRGPVLAHQGSNGLWYSAAWVAQAEDFAVLVVCNQGGRAAAQACDDLARVLIALQQQSQ